MDDIAQRSELLASILRDPSSWHAWLVEHPRRLATVLGLCADGAASLERDIAPLISALYHDANTGGGTMADNPANNPDNWSKLANALLNLLSAGLKEKKKTDKLKALNDACFKAMQAKDTLIADYEDGKVPAAKAALAKDIHKKLKELQDLLRKIRDTIDKDGDPSSDIHDASVKVGEIEGLLKGL